MLERNQIIQTLRAALEPLPFVNALWEGGAAAFNRVDTWSDIDLVVDAADEQAGEVLPIVEQTLARLGTIELQFRTPQAILGLHSQGFYRLAEAGPFLVVDFAVFRHSTPDKLLDVETHGDIIVHFDKTGEIKPRSLDQADLQNRLAARVESLKVTFPLFQPLILKEIHRGNAIEALAFYQGFALRPLVELLRMRYCPGRATFHTRYVYYDLPMEIVHELERLFFVRDLPDLAEKQIQIEAWVGELLASQAKN